MNIKSDNNKLIKCCTKCKLDKELSEFYKLRAQCKLCMNKRRRDKYKNNEVYRKKCIQTAICTKRKKILLKKEKLIKEIGIDNKKCKYCFKIKHKDRFRHNRLKCRDCERDDPKEKFKRYVRTRIYNCLKRRKSMRSIDYLGCSNNDYFNYIMNYNNDYRLENYGKVWHIDHVIPISLFDLSDTNQQLLAFNWRNTMPLSSKENLRKNNRIDTKQIKQHFEYLKSYHNDNNIKLKYEYISLFAKHLDAGNSLESQTTTPVLETITEELG